MARYRALKDGYLGTHRYAPHDRLGQVSKGEEFEWNGPKGSWMQPVEVTPAPEPVAKPEAVALSEIQQETPPPLSGDIVEQQEAHDKVLEGKKAKRSR